MGRGCLAGRVYAAAVIWPQRMYDDTWHNIKDSKKLSHKKRKEVEAKAHLLSEERVINALVGENASESTKESFRKKLRDEGKL